MAWAPGIATAAPALAPPDAAPDVKDACAKEAVWLTAFGGPPIKSTVMRFDAMRRRGGFGGEGPVTTFNEFGNVTRLAEEKYEWRPPRSNMSNEQLVVLRGASGPVPSYYGHPVRLDSGVVMHPQRDVWEHSEPSSLFVFPDGTWVRASGERAQLVRRLYAESGTLPPLPDLDADVAWEICGAMDPNDMSLPWDVWSIRGDRVALRLFSSRQEGELVYPFGSPDLAARAESAQRAQCAGGRCPWLRSAKAEGSLVRYVVSVRTAPTTERDEVKIAHVTPPLSAPPRADAPMVPGLPPSGVYQQFYEIREDTCPTRSAGQHFPSMMDIILLEHRDGKVFTTLESVEPRAPGILTASQMPGVELRAGSVTTRSITHLCNNYRMERELTLLQLTGNIIEVRDVSRYVGSTAGCRHTQLPSDCHRVAITTWVLARPACDARCDASYDGHWSYGSGDPAPAITATCSCP